MHTHSNEEWPCCSTETNVTTHGAACCSWKYGITEVWSLPVPQPSWLPVSQPPQLPAPPVPMATCGTHSYGGTPSELSYRGLREEQISSGHRLPSITPKWPPKLWLPWMPSSLLPEQQILRNQPSCDSLNTQCQLGPPRSPVWPSGRWWEGRL